MKNSFFLACLILLGSGCKQNVISQTDSSFEKGKRLSELTDKRLKESSGLAASVRNAGLLWTHNDSGNDANIFLIDENLRIKLTVTLEGIENRDWEDIAVGPGPDSTKTYVYVGDIGDNDSAYPEKLIYRFAEPTVGPDQNISISEFDTFRFKLEDGSKDTESLLIDHTTKNLYVVSKREHPVWVYEIVQPQNTTETITAKKVMSLPFKEIVAGDCFSKNGDILMKNYNNIYYWRNAEKKGVISLLKDAPLEIPYEKEPQGEAIAWATDGSGFYTLSEKKKKEPSYLYFYSKKKN